MTTNSTGMLRSDYDLAPFETLARITRREQGGSQNSCQHP